MSESREEGSGQSLREHQSGRFGNEQSERREKGWVCSLSQKPWKRLFQEDQCTIVCKMDNEWEAAV